MMGAGGLDSARVGAELLYGRAWQTASAVCTGSRRASAAHSATHGRLVVTPQVNGAGEAVCTPTRPIQSELAADPVEPPRGWRWPAPRSTPIRPDGGTGNQTGACGPDQRIARAPGRIHRARRGGAPRVDPVGAAPPAAAAARATVAFASRLHGQTPGVRGGMPTPARTAVGDARVPAVGRRSRPPARGAPRRPRGGAATRRPLRGADRRVRGGRRLGGGAAVRGGLDGREGGHPRPVVARPLGCGGGRRRRRRGAGGGRRRGGAPPPSSRRPNTLSRRRGTTGWRRRGRRARRRGVRRRRPATTGGGEQRCCLRLLGTDHPPPVCPGARGRGRGGGGSGLPRATGADAVARAVSAPVLLLCLGCCLKARKALRGCWAAPADGRSWPPQKSCKRLASASGRAARRRGAGGQQP